MGLSEIHTNVRKYTLLSKESLQQQNAYHPIIRGLTRKKLFTFSMMTFVDKCCFEIPHNALVHKFLSVVVITTLQRSKKMYGVHWNKKTTYCKGKHQVCFFSFIF